MARLKREKARREWMASSNSSSSSSWCRPQFWHLYKRLKLKQSPSNVLKHEQQQQQLFFRSPAYTATSPESIDNGRATAAAAGIQHKIAFCTNAKLYCAKTFEQRTPNAGLFHCFFLVSSQSVSQPVKLAVISAASYARKFQTSKTGMKWIQREWERNVILHLALLSRGMTKKHLTSLQPAHTNTLSLLLLCLPFKWVPFPRLRFNR